MESTCFRISLVEHLINRQVPLNDRTDVGSTSLVLACELPVDTDIIQLLIQAGADTNIANAEGITPLHAACKTHKIDIIELLLAHGANINAQDSVLYTPLHYAVENDDSDIVHTLLHNGADPTIAEQMGWDALVLALHEHGRCAELILPYIKDINATSINGWTPLMYAVRGASKDIVIKLIEIGANVNVIVDGLMPVTLSINRSDMLLFEYLWERTNKNLLLQNGEMENFIQALIYANFFKPKLMHCLFKVLDTPGLQLSTSRYLNILARKMHDIRSEEEFQAVDLIAVIKKLASKGAVFDTCDIEGFLGLTYRYNSHYKHEVLNVLVDSGVNINNDYFTYLTAMNDPEFTTTVLSFCISVGPIDIFQNCYLMTRLDIPMLKLIKYILRLCTPSAMFRKICVKNMKPIDLLNSDYVCYSLILESIRLCNQKHIKHDLTADEKVVLPKLYNEVIDLLESDRLPTLQELSRDVVRQSLSHGCPTTQEYLNRLQQLQVPEFLIDIIRCKKAVCSL